MSTEKQLKAQTQFKELLDRIPEFDGGVLAAPPWHTESLWAKIDEVAARIGSTPEHVAQMKGLAERLTSICYGHDFGVLWVPEPQIDTFNNEMEFLWIQLRFNKTLSFDFQDGRLVMLKIEKFTCEDMVEPNDEDIVKWLTWMLSTMNLEVEWGK